MHRFCSSGYGVCGSEDRRFFHAVRPAAGGVLRHLCTPCVLKTNIDSFCPVCFDVFEKSSLSLSIERVQCSKCRSKTHVSCVTSANSSNFLCPRCSNAPAFAFLDDGTKMAIDAKASKVLVAAARIASDSMRRAAAAARMEAERCVKEAAFSRMRAVEALERLALLSAQEDMNKKKQQQQQQQKKKKKKTKTKNKKKKLKGEVGSGERNVAQRNGLKNGVSVHKKKKSSRSIVHISEGKKNKNKKKKTKKESGDHGGQVGESKFGGVGKQSSTAES